MVCAGGVRMNAQDREALQLISSQIETLRKSVEKLSDPDAVKALTGLVEIAPTLKELADGYKAAGLAGNFVKWAAGISTATVALWALVKIFIFGDGK